MKPIPVGTLVDYHGSQQHGRYVIISHHCPHDLFPRSEWDEVAQYYPDGVAYTILPEGVPCKFGEIRNKSVYRVRRCSLTVVNCTREGFEVLTPFVTGDGHAEQDCPNQFDKFRAYADRGKCPDHPEGT